MTDPVQGLARWLANVTHRVPRWLKKRWPLVVVLAVVLPLVWIAASLAIRLKIFSLTAPPVTGEIQIYLTFLVGVLAAGVTLAGALLTRDINRRAEHRLKLETVVRGLEHLPDGHPRTAGSIATVVILGEQSIAMRVLQPAWDEKVVDDATATWLISEVLTTEPVDEAAAREAAAILLKHARSGLTEHDKPGFYNFPGVCLREWRTTWPAPAKLDILLAMAETLVSERLPWWANRPPAWPLERFWECYAKENDQIRRCVAVLIAPFRSGFGEVIDAWLAQDSERAAMAARIRQDAEWARAEPGRVPQAFPAMAERLLSWAVDEGDAPEVGLSERDGEERQLIPTSAPAPVDQGRGGRARPSTARRPPRRSPRQRSTNLTRHTGPGARRRTKP